jgi:hypothetical protein
VGLEFGIHGYKPYGASLVATRGFGDCKDKAALLVTMLKEAGVEADFALVRTRHRGDLDTDIASLSAFDHAIAYVPDLDLWIDATAEQHGIENLPFADQGVLALRLTRDGPVMGRTPILPAEKNQTKGELRVRLFPNGEAAIQGQVTTNGDTAAHLRRELETTHTRRERFEQLMSASMPGVKVSHVNITSLDALDRPVSYSYEARLPAYALVTPSSGLEFSVDQGQDMTKRFARLPRRSADLVVGPTGLIERRTELHIPEGFEAQSLPPPVELRTRFGSLALLVETRGSQMTIHRRVSLDIAQVSPEDYPDFVKFCRAVDEAMSGRVALRKRP